MNISIVNEKIVFWRDASPALRPAAAAAGSASPPAWTLRALAMTSFWLRQITPHTFTNMMSAIRMPGRDAHAARGLQVVGVEELDLAAVAALEEQDEDAGRDRRHGGPPEPPERPGCQLVDGVVPGRRLHLGERRHLHEVEVVEEADPRDPDDHVRPAGGEGPTVPTDDVQRIRNNHDIHPHPGCKGSAAGES